MKFFVFLKCLAETDDLAKDDLSECGRHSGNIFDEDAFHVVLVLLEEDLLELVLEVVAASFSVELEMLRREKLPVDDSEREGIAERCAKRFHQIKCERRPSKVQIMKIADAGIQVVEAQCGFDFSGDNGVGP